MTLHAKRAGRQIHLLQNLPLSSQYIFKGKGVGLDIKATVDVNTVIVLGEVVRETLVSKLDPQHLPSRYSHHPLHNLNSRYGFL